MIINCLNCNKKFNIDAKLIPEKGRLLQCSICNHKWHYVIPIEENKIEKNEIIQNRNNITISKSLSPENKAINKEKIKKTINNYKKLDNENKASNLKKKKINKNFSLAKVLNNLLIIIITFSALILILDTFKAGISNYFPFLIPLLDNLYQSFFDLNSFIKDLLT